MSKLLAGLTIDGKGLIQSVEAITDKIKYRKYANLNYVNVLYINRENTNVRLLDGKLDTKGSVKVKGIEMVALNAKMYALQTKKIVIKFAIIKEGQSSTIDIDIKDNSHITPELLKRYEEVKLMEEMKSFDLGQVLLGGLAGILLGAIGMMFFIMMYNSMM